MKSRPPRYDQVYFDGLAWLDEIAFNDYPVNHDLNWWFSALPDGDYKNLPCDVSLIDTDDGNNE